MDKKDSKKRNMINKVNVLRRVVQLGLFLLLPGIMAEVYNCIKVIVLAVAEGSGDFGTIAGSAVILFGITAATLLGGRFFCGWLCSFGAFGDLLYRLPRLVWKKGAQASRMPSTADMALKFAKYLVLAISVVFIWGLQLVTVPAGSNPWDFYGMLTSMSGLESIWESFPAFAAAAVLLVLIAGASVAKERSFCRYLCPLGAYLGLINKVALTRIVKPRQNCGSCKLCTAKCSMGINLSETDIVKSADCIQCMECARVCPKQNVYIEVDSQHSKMLKAGILTCVIIIGTYFLGNGIEGALAKTTWQSGKDGDLGAYQGQDGGSLGSQGAGGSGSQNSGSAGGYGAAKGLADGEYTGSARGYRGTTKVKVTVKDEMITGVEIVSTNDDRKYINRAATSVISDIVNEQSTDVDTVSGATYSSNAIKNAVANALKNGTGKSGDSDDSDDGVTNDGGFGDDGGFFGGFEHGDNWWGGNYEDGENPWQGDGFGNGDDSGNSSSKTAKEADYADGEYTGTGTGFRGQISVTVTVKDGKVTAIRVNSSKEDRRYFDAAWGTVTQRIIDEQDVNVDGVSGATFSSNGIREAVANALGETYIASETRGGHGHGRGRGH